MRVNRFIRSWLIPLLLFSATLILYWQTQYPGVGGRICPGDSAKFQFLGLEMGLAHGPGFPLYILLNKLFVSLPLGIPIWMKANLLSAVSGSLAIVMLYLICVRLRMNPKAPPSGNALSRDGRSRPGGEQRAIETSPSSGDQSTADSSSPTTVISAVAASLAAAVGIVHWTQATETEVYSLNAFFFLAVALKLSDWMRRGERRDLLLALLAFALSFGNHLLTVALIPAVLYAALAARGREGRSVVFSVKTVLPAALMAFAGTLPYLWLYFRGRAGALNLEGIPSAMEPGTFIRYILGLRYESMMFEAPLPVVLGDRLPFFLSQIHRQYGLLLLIAAMAGLVLLWRRNRRILILLAWVFTGVLFFGLNYSIYDITVYYIPLYLLLALPLHASILSALESVGNSRVVVAALLAVCAMLIGWNGWTHGRAIRVDPAAVPLNPVIDELQEDAVFFYSQWGERDRSLMNAYYHYTGEPGNDESGLRFHPDAEPLEDTGRPVYFDEEALLLRFQQQGGFLVGRQQPLEGLGEFIQATKQSGQGLAVVCCGDLEDELLRGLVSDLPDLGAELERISGAGGFIALVPTTGVPTIQTAPPGTESLFPLVRTVASVNVPERITIHCGQRLALVTQGPRVIHVVPGGLGLIAFDGKSGAFTGAYNTAASRRLTLWKAVPLSLLGQPVRFEADDVIPVTTDRSNGRRAESSGRQSAPPGQRINPPEPGEAIPPYDTRTVHLPPEHGIPLEGVSAGNAYLVGFSLLVPRLWPARQQQLTVSLSGRDLGTWPVTPGWNPFSFMVDDTTGDDGPGASSLALELSTGPFVETSPVRPTSESEALLAELGDAIGYPLVVESAGWWCGNRVSFIVGGLEVSRDGSGLLVLVIKPASGPQPADGSPPAVVPDPARFRCEVFDTGGDPGAGSRLGRYFEQLPDNSIIIVAARGNASTWFSPEARRALAGIGGRADLSTLNRPSYILVGLKSRFPGQRPELHSVMAPCRFEARGTAGPVEISLDTLSLIKLNLQTGPGNG